MSDKQPTTITDETGIPIKWAFAIVGAAVGLLAASALGLLFLGALTTRLANAEKAVADIQTDRTLLIRARADKDTALEGRLTSMETTMKSIASDVSTLLEISRGKK